MNAAHRPPLLPDQVAPLGALAGAWVVERGAVDLFAVRVAAGAPVGRREHLLRIEAGGLLCATAGSIADGVEILASAGPETALAPVPLRAALDPWVRAVAAPLRDPDQAWTEQLAAAGEATLPRDARLGCFGDQVFWASVLEGRVAGGAGLAAAPGDPPLALAAATPLRALAPSRLLLQPTAALDEAGLAAALAGHRALLLRHAASVLAARTAARAARIEQGAAAAEASLADGLARISGLAADRAAPGEGDPCWLAVAAIAEALGAPAMPMPAGIPPALPAPDRVAALAEAAGLRLRPVLLRDRWWRQDNGPLLAWRADGAPVALLRAGGAYRVHDETGAHRLRAAEAEALAPEALMAYRSLPAAPVAPRAVLRQALAGLSGERAALLWLSLAAALLGLALPIALGVLAAGIVPRSDRTALLMLGGGVVVAALAAGAVELSRGLLLQRIEARVTLAAQAALLDRLLRLPVALFRRFGTGDLADRVLLLDQVRRHLGGARLGAMLGGLTALANLAVMFACNLRLGLLGLGLALVTLLGGLWFCRPQAAREREQAEHRGRTEALVLETIGGIAKLKVAAATERAFAAWARLYARQHRARVASLRLRMGQQVFLAFILPAALALLFLAAAALTETLRQQVETTEALAETIGEPLRAPAVFGIAAWLAFSAAFGQLMAGIAQMLQAVSSALPVLPLEARAAPVTEAMPESGAAVPSLLAGGCEFSRVSFAYSPNAPLVLQELSFVLRPGEFVAIVGPSGSGKSTILRLLLGFERPGAGAVLFDGRPLDTLDAAAVRRQIGVVLQNGRLQPGTILDNIGAGRPLGLAEAWAAAELAGLGREIRALPMGMYTVLAEGGGTLSGGQRQRLLIARALARKPRLLLLDEATSALDNRAQAAVAEAVAGLGLSRLVVAHRLSTIARADRILVLDGGRLVQEGRYAELLERPGLFRELAARQLG